AAGVETPAVAVEYGQVPGRALHRPTLDQPGGVVAAGAGTRVGQATRVEPAVGTLPGLVAARHHLGQGWVRLGEGELTALPPGQLAVLAVRAEHGVCVPQVGEHRRDVLLDPRGGRFLAAYVD